MGKLSIAENKHTKIVYSLPKIDPFGRNRKIGKELSVTFVRIENEQEAKEAIKRINDLGYGSSHSGYLAYLNLGDKVSIEMNLFELSILLRDIQTLIERARIEN